MPFTRSKVLKKVLSIGLSAALIYNTTLPAFGQEFFSSDNPPTRRQRIESNLPAARRMHEVGPAVIDRTNYNNTHAEVARVINEYFESKYKQKMESSAYARAEEIKKEILGDEQKDLQREYFADRTENQNNIPPDYKAEYFNYIRGKADEKQQENTAEYQKFLRELGQQETLYLSQGAPAEAVAEWKAAEIADKQASYQENKAGIEAFYHQEVPRRVQVQLHRVHA